MKIETKFNIGDRVWFIGDDRVKTLKIASMDIKILPKEISMLYHIGEPGNIYSVFEDRTFATKQELLDSL